ncbi:MAG: hypothetical protein QOD51_821 [Candidatus Eremiobacteraeota bacterium]|jgi:hypothetical protein|nr:hypothetical protein [Candidatus Eremiobacteraeota bacterium]
MKRISALLGGAVLGVALLAACGGGGGGSGTSAPGGPLPPGGPTTAPSITPSGNFSSTDAVAIPTPAPGAATVPVPLASDASGASANAAIPASANVPPDATVAATYSSAADASLPALAVRRAVSSVRGLREDNKKTVIAYLRLQFSADVTMPQAPDFTFVVPGTLPTNAVSYWLAFIDPLRSAAGWQAGFEGPATVSAAQTAAGKPGTKLAFASNGQPITFVANQAYYFAVYAVSATVASPTPVPSSVPSNPPSEGKPAAILATPANVQFASITSAPVPVTFAQQGFTGPFTLHGDCTGVVNTSGASPTWTITPVGQGRCVIVGLGDRGSSAVVHIGVVTPFETPRPSSSPTTAPSHSPEPTHAPTTAPSGEPSHSPEPTHAPTTQPSSEPSHSPEPTHAPTTEPSHSPAPTATPASSPTPGTAAKKART